MIVSACEVVQAVAGAQPGWGTMHFLAHGAGNPYASASALCLVSSEGTGFLTLWLQHGLTLSAGSRATEFFCAFSASSHYNGGPPTVVKATTWNGAAFEAVRLRRPPGHYKFFSTAAH